MKQFFLLIILCAFGIESSISAQKFVDTSNLWHTTRGGFNPSAGGAYYGTGYAYRFQDTLMSGDTVYYKLYSARGINSNTFEYTGEAYREDDQGVVYGKLWPGDSEREIMDQSFEVGDTLNGSDPNYFQAVIGVDSVQLTDGSFRKRIELESQCGNNLNKVYWIQGIGYTTGLTWDSSCLVDGLRAVDCYYYNEQVLLNLQPSGLECGEVDRYLGKFVNRENRWYTYEGSAFPNGYVSNYWYRFQDTIVWNNRTYAKLYRSDNDPNNNYEDQQSYWREDEAGRVFRYFPELRDDRLVYDFNLEVGDSISYISSYIHVTELDTVELKSGELRKRWTFSSANRQPLKVVEGVGAYRGTFSLAYWITDVFNDLFCYYEGIQLRYATENSAGISNEGNCIVLDLEESIILTGQQNNSNVGLSWSYEFTDDLYYLIERSSDAFTWREIGSVEKDGQLQLTYVDDDPLTGINYYRIKAVSVSAEEKYSNAISVNFDMASEISIYPSPAFDMLYISGLEIGIFRIYDAVGSTVANGVLNGKVVDVSSLLQGVYFIELSDNSQEKTILKFIKS